MNISGKPDLCISDCPHWIPSVLLVCKEYLSQNRWWAKSLYTQTWARHPCTWCRHYSCFWKWRELFSQFIRGQTEDMSIACSSQHGGTRLGDNGHNVASGCQGWERGPGKEMTSKASNTRTATISAYPLLSLFYISNWLNITCIFFDYRIWHNSISRVNYYNFAVKPFLTHLCISKSEANEYITNLRFLFWIFLFCYSISSTKPW